VRNLRASPHVRIKVGRRRYSGTAQLQPGDDWSARLDQIGEALGPARRLDARLLRWFIRVLRTPRSHLFESVEVAREGWSAGANSGLACNRPSRRERQRRLLREQEQQKLPASASDHDQQERVIATSNELVSSALTAIVTPGSRPGVATMTAATRLVVGLMALEAVSLAVIASQHLGHVLAGGQKPFRPNPAGIAEAIIGLVLLYGIVALLRGFSHARGIAIATVLFAIAGFIPGLTFTLRGGDTIDIAYHATVLPLLLVTLLVLLRRPRYYRRHGLSIPAGLEEGRR
jgi:hypothetical protein